MRYSISWPAVARGGVRMRKLTSGVGGSSGPRFASRAIGAGSGHTPDRGGSGVGTPTTTGGSHAGAWAAVAGTVESKITTSSETMATRRHVPGKRDREDMAAPSVSVEKRKPQNGKKALPR